MDSKKGRSQSSEQLGQQTTELKTYVRIFIRLIGNYFLGNTGESSKPHLVNWQTVCHSKRKGGLGLKQSALMNQAMLAKAGWRLLNHSDGLWSKALSQKYLKGNNCGILLPSIQASTGSSST